MQIITPIWSLTHQHSIFQRYHSDKHFSELLPIRRRQKSTGIDMEQNDVAGSLCIWTWATMATPSWSTNRLSSVASRMRIRRQTRTRSKFSTGAEPIHALSHIQHRGIRGFLKWYALYKSTFYLLTYLLTFYVKPIVYRKDILYKYEAIRCDTRCYFKVRSKADTSQLNTIRYEMLFQRALESRHESA